MVADNFFTGRKRNVEHWVGHPNFELMHHDVVNPIYIEVDQIYHLASPASPPNYMYNPIKTIKTNTVGTINMLGMCDNVSPGKSISLPLAQGVVIEGITFLSGSVEITAVLDF